MEGSLTSTFCGKLGITLLCAIACALSSGAMLPDGAPSATALLLVGAAAYLLAALMLVSLTTTLRVLFS